MGTVRLATRGSPLALRQTEEVADLLRRAHDDRLDHEPGVRTAEEIGDLLGLAQGQG
jgi:porphobilinogen deaminase